MNFLLEYLTGMSSMTDQVIASDMLITSKSGVINYAMAVTEATTPEIKEVLSQQLEDAINSHEAISKYMIEQGFYHPFNVNEQIQLDRQNVELALNIPSQ